MKLARSVAAVFVLMILGWVRRRPTSGDDPTGRITEATMTSRWLRTTRQVGAPIFMLIGTLVIGACSAPAEAQPMNWHPQSGQQGPVADGAVARLSRSEDGVSFEIATESLQPNHAYTIWVAIVNEPAACSSQPCPPPDILQNTATDSQVVFGAGAVADANGRATFKGEAKKGPLPNGWLAGGELKKPLTAQILLIVNSHGPVIEGYMPDMTTTYRAGCADAGLPEIFPETAKADGRPGPNTCQLYQSAVFPGGVDVGSALWDRNVPLHGYRGLDQASS